MTRWIVIRSTANDGYCFQSWSTDDSIVALALDGGALDLARGA